MKNIILTINAGSSSIKFALFKDAEELTPLLSGSIDRIGVSDSTISYTDESGEEITNTVVVTDTESAVTLLQSFLEEHIDFTQVKAVGHRIVHGMGRDAHARVTKELIADLSDLVAIDPEHLPQEIALMEALLERFPTLTQVACFDTVFHHHLPRVAQILPLPRRFEQQGLRRYGFHGLSLAYVYESLLKTDPSCAQGKMIVLHLGNGASVTAMCDGKSVDTSMGFTPAGGILMGSRSGDIDPGALVYILQSENMTPLTLSHLVHEESGLKGISETSSDMYDLLQSESTDVRAKEAVDVFCYEAKKRIGSYAAVLNGVDTIVFTGGMGEKSATIRARICDGLEHLGITIDEVRNQACEEIISTESSKVTVRVQKTNEEQYIATIAKRFSNE
jgi:acetate kinase